MKLNGTTTHWPKVALVFRDTSNYDMWNLRAKMTLARDTLNVFSSIILDAFNISQSPIVNKITHSLSVNTPII